MTRCAAMMLAAIACLFSRGASLQCSRSSVPPKPSGVFAYGEVLARVCS